jgi:metalloprotease
MKARFFVLFLFISLSNSVAFAQINVDKTLGALKSGVASFTFSNEDAAQIASQAVKKMDSTHVVAGPKDGYTLRLNRVFAKHSSENGLALNYKVYITKEVNAFACADGSVRVFSGLMDIMDDNQLLAVIGHEIGHVANQDTKDAVRSAYRNAALVGVVGAASDKAAKISEGQAGQIATALLDSKYSRKQESEADTFSYDFMKRNGYDVNAVESAFRLLAQLSGNAEANFITQMMSSHPDPNNRAENAKNRAVADGLYKEYTQKSFSNKAVTSTKKPTTKKPTTKKKK